MHRYILYRVVSLDVLDTSKNITSIAKKIIYLSTDDVCSQCQRRLVIVILLTLLLISIQPKGQRSTDEGTQKSSGKFDEILTEGLRINCCSCDSCYTDSRKKYL